MIIIMQRLVTASEPVLNPDGTPNAGYCTVETQIFKRSAIHANPFRIKEWDFYQIEDTEGKLVLQLTFGHASYMGEANIMLFDVQHKRFIRNVTVLIPFPFGRLHMPESAAKQNVVEYHSKRADVLFTGDAMERQLTMRVDDVKTDLILKAETDHSLIINIPFNENPHAFYYDFKQNCMSVEGRLEYMDRNAIRQVNYGKDRIEAYAILDWGRGVWPWHNEWYWSNGQGMVDGKLLGFNLGCGFGNTEQATENILFYENKPHKLDQMTIHHEADFMKPWTLTDNEGRCHLTMTPEYDRITKIKIAMIDNCTHQVFGKFNGEVTLDDGRILHVVDVPAFAEHAVNNW